MEFLIQFLIELFIGTSSITYCIDPLTAALIVGALSAGAGVHGSEQQKKAAGKTRREQKRMAAIDAKYSPWVDPQQGAYDPGKGIVADQSAGNAIKGLSVGLDMYNQGQQREAYNKYLDKLGGSGGDGLDNVGAGDVSVPQMGPGGHGVPQGYGGTSTLDGASNMPAMMPGTGIPASMKTDLPVGALTPSAATPPPPAAPPSIFKTQAPTQAPVASPPPVHTGPPMVPQPAFMDPMTLQLQQQAQMMGNYPIMLPGM